jgi:hypothetical protein
MTLATVNSSPQTDTFRKITVNGKGLVTATSAVGSSDITTALGYTPVNKAGDTMTGALGFVAGSNSAPGAFFSGDTNTGLFAPAADTVSITTGGTERVRIGSSGQLGIAGANYGTAGQVLTSSGSGAAPAWAAPTLPAGSK